MSRVGGGQVAIGDAALLQVATGHLRRHIQHPGHSQGNQRLRVGCVSRVAQVQEWQHPGRRVGVDVRGAGRVGAAGPAGQQRVLAELLVPPVELAVTSCNRNTLFDSGRYKDMKART